MIDLSKSKQKWPVSLLLYRLAWGILQSSLASLPKQCSFIRIFSLRLFGAKIGSNCLVMPGVKVLLPFNLILDSYVAIGRDVEIYNFAPVKIGRMTVVSQYCFLCTGSHDYTNKSMPLIWKPILIGSNCWIAAKTYVAPNVSIFDGAVIGACSVVTRNMPEWMVCAGNPCVPIKERKIFD